jgi:magnesium chelatase family protein
LPHAVIAVILAMNTCTIPQIQRYLSKISGPLTDRIDIHIEVASVKYRDLASREARESSWEIKKPIDATRKIQIERFKGMKIYSNAQMTNRHLKSFTRLMRLVRNYWD